MPPCRSAMLQVGCEHWWKNFIWAEKAEVHRTAYRTGEGWCQSYKLKFGITGLLSFDLLRSTTVRLKGGQTDLCLLHSICIALNLTHSSVFQLVFTGTKNGFFILKHNLETQNRGESVLWLTKSKDKILYRICWYSLVLGWMICSLFFYTQC